MKLDSLENLKDDELQAVIGAAPGSCSRSMTDARAQGNKALARTPGAHSSRRRA